MKDCFECGKEATEEHHVIPKSLGGTKTVPLCTKCHMKVHGLDKTHRADWHPELIKRGHDKIRVWSLFSVYLASTEYEAATIKDIVNIVKQEFDLSITRNQAKRMLRRVEEMESSYLNDLFETYIGEDVSHLWNEERYDFKIKISSNIIHKYIDDNEIDDATKIDSDLIKRMAAEINTNFLAEIRRQKI